LIEVTMPKKTNPMNHGRALLLPILTALVLAACGGGGGDSASTTPPDNATQAGVIVPSGMGGTAMVGQAYEGQVDVVPSGATVTVVSLAIVNEVAGGAQPSIDLAGHVSWTPNEQDFADVATLRVTGTLSDGGTISTTLPMDVRKERTVLQETLTDTEQSYSDDEGRYLVRVSRQSVSSVISGTIAITETYTKGGEFSWAMKPDGDGFDAHVVQAPTTRAPVFQTTTAASMQMGLLSSGDLTNHPINKISMGDGVFSGLNEQGSVLGHFKMFVGGLGGHNVYSSRPAGVVTYRLTNGAKTYSEASLEGYEVFWFGANCTDPSNSGRVINMTDCYTLAHKTDPDGKGKSPVILIHGFSGEDNLAWKEGIVGGGEDTWGKTAKLLTQNGHPVFEMRWLSYMPFEDAAGALAKFGKAVAQATGVKPIILAHSFGGVVSHLALQNKGREWKTDAYGAGQWQTVNSDGVFAKLITLNSPLSGINNKGAASDFTSAKELYNSAGNLINVDFPAGVDSTDKLIYSCYSITCAQAGAKFSNSAGFKSLAIHKAMIDGYSPVFSNINEITGGVIRKLKEGETIADMQEGILQQKENAPFLTVTGFRPVPGMVAHTVPNIFNTYGDGLISLIGQAAIPQDFSNNAFDFEANAAENIHLADTTYPTLQNKSAKLLSLAKGDCIKYPAQNRDYLMCGYSAHTNSKSWVPRYYDNDRPTTPIDSTYSVAYYNGGVNHAMPWLAYGIDYIAIPAQYSPFTTTVDHVATITGRMATSGPAQQVGLVGTASLSPIKSALIWATLIEKSTGISKRYFNGAQSDSNGRFNIDIGSVVSKEFGADAVLADYRVDLRVDVVGFKPWKHRIEDLSEAVDLGDIDMSVPVSSIHAMSPSSAKVGISTTFTVMGANLPKASALDITFNGCANIQVLLQSATKHQFTCTPNSIGTITAVVRTAAGTTPLGSFAVAVGSGPALQVVDGADLVAGLFDLYLSGEPGEDFTYKIAKHASLNSGATDTYSVAYTNWELTSGGWGPASARNNNLYLSASGQWITEGASGTLKQTSPGVFLYTTTALSRNLSVAVSTPSTLDLSTVSDLHGMSSVDLPPGAKLFAFGTSTAAADEYRLNSGSGYSGLTSLAAFVTQYTNSQDSLCRHDLCWHLGAGSTSGVLSLETLDGHGDPTPINTQGTWAIQTVRGVPLLVLNLPSSVATQAGLSAGQKMFYAVIPGGNVQQGKFSPAGSADIENNSGINYSFNRIALNAILAHLNLPFGPDGASAGNMATAYLQRASRSLQSGTYAPASGDTLFTADSAPVVYQQYCDSMSQLQAVAFSGASTVTALEGASALKGKSFVKGACKAGNALEDLLVFNADGSVTATGEHGTGSIETITHASDDVAQVFSSLGGSDSTGVSSFLKAYKVTQDGFDKFYIAEHDMVDGALAFFGWWQEVLGS
jgi:pimeloyl-ACP methyl ester carboxylesterase